jgi:hypothetical protein
MDALNTNANWGRTLSLTLIASNIDLRMGVSYNAPCLRYGNHVVEFIRAFT